MNLNIERKQEPRYPFPDLANIPNNISCTHLFLRQTIFVLCTFEHTPDFYFLDMLLYITVGIACRTIYRYS